MQTTDKIVIIIIIIIPGDLPAFKLSINFSRAQCTNIMLLEIIKKIIKIVIIIIIIIIAAQNYYKNWRHDKVARVVQWNLCKKFAAMQRNLVYDYARSPEAVIENDQVKLSWDFRIQADHHLDHNRLDCGCSSVAFCYTRSRKKPGEDRPLTGLKSVEVRLKDLELQKCICYPYCNRGSWDCE